MDETFALRIYQAPACPALELAEAEHGFYRGAGATLYTVAGGVITDLVYVECLDGDDADLPDLAQAWVVARQAEGREVWRGEASCYSLCNPTHVAAGEDVRAWARLRLAVWA